MYLQLETPTLKIAAALQSSPQLQYRLHQWCSTWAKSPPRERFYAFWGDFSFQGGNFCRLKHTQMLHWFQKKQYLLLWNQSIWCTPTPWFVTKVIKHISDWSRNDQTNIVLCKVALHQLTKTTENVTGCKTIASKSSLGGLYVCVGSWTFNILSKKQLIRRVSYFYGGFGTLFGRG